MTSTNAHRAPKLTMPFEQAEEGKRRKVVVTALHFAAVQQLAITKAEPGQKSEAIKKRDFLLWDENTPGFAIRFHKGGTRTYLVRRRIRGLKRQKEITVGDVDTMSFEDAKLKATQLFLQMRGGVDPVAKQALTEDDIKARSITVWQVFELYTNSNQKKHGRRRQTTIKDMKYVLGKYLEDLAGLPIAEITKSQCEEAFRKISEDAPTQANKAMTYLRTLMYFARNKFETKGTYLILQFNPVAEMLKAQGLNEKGHRRGRIPKKQIRMVWRAMKQRGELGATPDIRCAADWVRFRMMTGTRLEESRTLRYGWINWEDNLIEIPGSVAKNHQMLPIWISPQMRELIERRRALYLAMHPGEEAPPPDAYVFPSESSTSGHIMSARVALKAIAGPTITEYDVRRTFEDVATECRVDPDVRRRLLNHRLAEVHVAHYANNPEALIEPMNQICAWLDSPEPIEATVAPAPAVVALEGTRGWRGLGAQELDKLVWMLPAMKLAEVFDVTDNCINKRCKVLGIARPPRGYWQKLAVGRVSEWPRRAQDA